MSSVVNYTAVVGNGQQLSWYCKWKWPSERHC